MPRCASPAQSPDIQLCQTGKDSSELLQPLPVIGCCCVSTGPICPFHDLKVTWSSSPHQQVSQDIQEKTSPGDNRKGDDQVAVPPPLISWFQLLKLLHIYLLARVPIFFFYDEWGFLIHVVFFFRYVFFSTEEEDEGKWKGFCLAWNCWGFAGGFFAWECQWQDASTERSHREQLCTNWYKIWFWFTTGGLAVLWEVGVR